MCFLVFPTFFLLSRTVTVMGDDSCGLLFLQPPSSRLHSASIFFLLLKRHSFMTTTTSTKSSSVIAHPCLRSHVYFLSHSQLSMYSFLLFVCGCFSRAPFPTSRALFFFFFLGKERALVFVIVEAHITCAGCPFSLSLLPLSRGRFLHACDFSRALLTLPCFKQVVEVRGSAHLLYIKAVHPSARSCGDSIRGAETTLLQSSLLISVV